MSKSDTLESIAVNAARAFKSMCEKRRAWSTVKRAEEKARTDLKSATDAWIKAEGAFRAATEEQP